MRFSLLAILLLAACGSAPGQAGNSVDAGGAPVRMTGSRDEQVAQLLAAIVPVGASRDWAAARAAFPGARWEERTSDTSPTRVEGGITYPSQLDSLGYSDALEGSIDLNGDRFTIFIAGTPERVTLIRLNAPEGSLVSRTALRRALSARGVGWRLIRCDPIGDTITELIVELSAGSRSATFQDTFSGQASAYIFSFGAPLYDPADPPGECRDQATEGLR
jgi:hypothetical protein